MKLIDIKDTLPVGFIPIQETVDTRESPSGPTHHSESFLPPGVCVDIFMCGLLQKHFRRPYCVPTNKPCCFWHVSDLALLWHVLGRGVEVSRTHPFLWDWGSPLDQFTRETDCSLSLAHPPAMLKPSFAQDPEAKGKKKQKTLREYKCPDTPTFGSWSMQEKSEPERLQVRVLKIWNWGKTLSHTEQEWVADMSEASSGSRGSLRFLSRRQSLNSAGNLCVAEPPQFDVQRLTCFILYYLGPVLGYPQEWCGKSETNPENPSFITHHPLWNFASHFFVTHTLFFPF